MDQFKPYRVLVVEDDPNHSLLIQLAFESGDPLARIHLLSRAEEAMEYLLERNEADEADDEGLPAVIVLDISMPGAAFMEGCPCSGLPRVRNFARSSVLK